METPVAKKEESYREYLRRMVPVWEARRDDPADDAEFRDACARLEIADYVLNLAENH